MGASICQQTCAINDRELVKEQLELQPKSLDSRRECSQVQDQPITDQLRINIQNSSHISYNLADQQQNQSKESSVSNDNPEAMTPWLPCGQNNFNGEQYIQLLNTEIVQSIKLQSQLVSSQNGDILPILEFKQQQSNSSYPRFCNDEKGNKLLNMQIIDDNVRSPLLSIA
ncbi:unnamed protein product [Paramecium octaurelia]|uniref:Uncharacterized protein n=1 Tax=Paramecium octaurelia TaxID=43137 RepID=A0A8S1W0D5_PAROT|nr:unnamed protein product [Paramecium octaurelia]